MDDSLQSLIDEERKVLMSVTNSNKLKRNLLIFSGYVCIALGIAGMLLPLMPTTVFLIMAAACFAKSSPNLHDWLLNHKVFGKYIKNYLEGRGIPLSSKVFSVSLLLVTIGYSFYIVNNFWVRIVLAIIAIAVSVHILSIKTMVKETHVEIEHYPKVVL